jgi:hypothetical protein
VYKRCIYKTKWTRYLPIDNGNHGQLEDKAAKLYRQLYDNFAKSVHPTPPPIRSHPTSSRSFTNT